MNSILKSENGTNMTDELLQSEEWMRFQEAAGRRVARLCGEEWSANGVVHRLPIVGEYLYIPRGPRAESTKHGSQIPNKTQDTKHETWSGEVIGALLVKAKELNVGWIRIEPETEAALAEIREAVKGVRIVKAPHDMQPRETFVVDLSPAEEELLAAMKPKARYNIGVAKKRGVNVAMSSDAKYVEAFIRLVTGTADRKGIVPHPKSYYEAMCVSLLGEGGMIFAAEKDRSIVAANLVVFHGNTATYLHGGSDERFRADMAPFLLQWEAMCDAKRRGCARYDFGGVSMSELEAGAGKWLGITRFKTGFSPSTSATVFPGAYDVVLSPLRYAVYRMMQKMKKLLR
jgi:peptidoglycan pentaglycine glycine transferase (the first glycine)